MSEQTIALHFVRTAVAHVDRRGFDVGEILRPAGITRSALERDPTPMTAGQLTTVMRGLLRVTDDELFGLGAQHVSRGTFKLLTMALIHAPDLRTLLRWSVEFSRIPYGVPAVTVRFGPEVTRVEVDTTGLGDPDHLGIGTVLSVIYRFCGWMVGRRIKLRAVELPYGAARGQPEAYEVLFGRPPVFDAPVAALIFASELLAAPTVRDERDLLDYLRRSPADFLARRDYGSSMTDRVRRILARGLHGEWPSSEEVAGRLSLSVQYLRRLLREEGTSMRQIKEEILRDAAIDSLARGGESVPELSRRLGFSEPSAFRRAFRRWTGSPPGSYRRG